MDIKEYISSGIIENYILGATTSDENEEIEKLARIHPEIKAEIEANQFALTEYVMQLKKDPPIELKDKILSKLAELELEDTGENEESKTAITRTLKPQKGNDISAKSIRRFSWLSAASVTLLVFSLGFNFYLYSSLKQTNQKLVTALSQNTQFANNLKVSNERINQLGSELAIISKPTNKLISLKGLPDFPDASVAIFWDLESKDVYLQIKNLPKPPAGKQYQLWSINGEKVTDAGLIDFKEDGASIYKMKNVSQANAFAITLEKEGGVQVAEGPMYVLGEV